ncbi:SNF2 family domain-containing protein [Cladophialophora immunda]|nr:SNF2 family domain-containing protein [Cladophialophora immunda]
MFKRRKLDIDGRWQNKTILNLAATDPASPAPPSSESGFTSSRITSSTRPYTTTRPDSQSREPDLTSLERPPSPYQSFPPNAETSNQERSVHTADGNVCQAASPSEEDDGFPQVCFGMFVVANLRPSARHYLDTSQDCFPVEVHSGQIYEAHDATEFPQSGETRLRIAQITCNRTTDVLQHLQNGRDIALEYYCRAVQSQSQRTRKKPAQTKEYELLVNVFGNENFGEEFGVFFDKLAIYLQDPVICHRNVPYRNPQLLSQDDDLVMTRSLRPRTNIETFSAPADVFDTLLHTDGLPEAECPAMLRTRLLAHQRQALFFMRRNEGTSCVGDSPHQMWTEKRTWTTEYTNVITGERQHSRPKEFFGGLIADQMGLGKTLQMISLLASDHDSTNPMQCVHELPLHMARAPLPCCSLVIVPASLLETWQYQLKEHLKMDSLRWCVYHGSRRQISHEGFSSHHIVLTTYNVVASEYRKTLNDGISSSSTLIFSSAWRRVILDEAHYIANLSALRTKAVCAIEARSRWAVTGTPIQNRLSDLAALVHFLRVEPFNRPSVFDEHIVQPWKSRSDLKAVQKLRTLIECVAIRRSKNILSLPDRTDQIRHIDFDGRERSIYEQVRLRIRDNALCSVATPKHCHILQWINDLRGLCSHGQIDADSISIDAAKDSLIDDNVVAEIGLTTDPSLTDTLSAAGTVDAASSEAVTSNSMDESEFGFPDGTPVWSLGQTWLPGRRQDLRCPPSESLSPRTGKSSPSASSSEINEDVMICSSKIQSLVSDLCEDDGKAVVFSFWRRTLDLVSQSLTEAGLAFQRFDGTMSPRDRELSLSSFRKDPSVKVLLATISAAGVGLGITVANLACLLEPQWNPSVEEQALSRVHRMGQTKPVKTIRYVVRDSIEENILELQQRKLRLAQLAMSGQNRAVGTGLIEDLKILLK